MGSDGDGSAAIGGQGGRRGGPHGGRSAARRPDRPRAARGQRADRERPARAFAPPLEGGAEELPEDVRRELRSLPTGVADRVAAQLAAAAELIDEDPEAAYAHARTARDIAGRIAVVREAAGIAAYRTGRYGEARAELRAYTRLSGDVRHLPVLADCERGLGRPEQALALAGSPDVGRLDPAGRVEMRIVASGARRDLGQPDAAVVALRGPDLDPAVVHEWTPRLWYAYADALLAAGRTAEALTWFRAAARVDAGDETDAASRVVELEATAD